MYVKAAAVGLTFLSNVYYLERLLLMLYLIFSTVTLERIYEKLVSDAAV